MVPLKESVLPPLNLFQKWSFVSILKAENLPTQKCPSVNLGLDAASCCCTQTTQGFPRDQNPVLE